MHNSGMNALEGNARCLATIAALGISSMRSALGHGTMDRCLSDSKKCAGTNVYVEAYDEAVNSYFWRDLEVWDTLLALHARFLLRAWEHPLPDERAKINSGH